MNAILWSFAPTVIGNTPQQPFNWGHQDGQPNGNSNSRNWLYTPSNAYISPSVAPTSSGTIPTSSPTNSVNIDLGANALREAANIGYGIACVIGATILLMRAATNVVINHPTSKKSEKNIAYFETCILCLGWIGTLVGMVSSGLGYEPKTGWAVFSVAIFSIIGYAVCYAYEFADVNAAAADAKDPRLDVGVQGPMGIQAPPMTPADGALQTGMTQASLPPSQYTYRPPSVGARPTSAYTARPNV